MSKHSGLAVICDYNDCNELIAACEDNYVGDGYWGGETDHCYCCDKCQDKIENVTGYCGMGCQLGYGCSQEC